MKNNILIAITFFLIGAGVMYLLKAQSPINNPRTTVRLIQSCLNAINALDKQSTSCLAAYKEFNDCASDINTCDMSQSKEKLQNLEKLRLSAVETVKNETAIINEIGKDLVVSQ